MYGSWDIVLSSGVGIVRDLRLIDMLMTNEQVEARLSSPDNLANRLASLRNPPKKADLVDLGIPTPSRFKDSDNVLPFMPPSVDTLVEKIDEKINLRLAEEGATGVLLDSITQLRQRLNEVESPAQLSKIASDMGKIVIGINRNETDKKMANFNQVIVFKPMMMTENHYESVRANE